MALRQRVLARRIGKLRRYLKEPQPDYALNQWKALTRILEDGEWEIDDGATERANRDIAGRGNWTSFVATAAVRRRPYYEASSLPASGLASSRLPGCVTCTRASRRILSPGSELVPHNWKPATWPWLKQSVDTRAIPRGGRRDA